MNKFVITYKYTGNDPKAIADSIRIEQTIEFPLEATPEWIQQEVVAQVLEIQDIGNGQHIIKIEYNPEDAGPDFTQLLNMFMGNATLYAGVKVIDIQLPDVILNRLKGPRYGVSGLREYFGAKKRPLLTSAIKPMGLTSKEFAVMAKTVALAGFDIIKDDDHLMNQKWAMWEERTRIVCEAVAEANAETGLKTMFAPCLNIPAERVLEAAHKAKEWGAGSVLILPGVTGFDSMRAIAENDKLGFVVQAHPSSLGSMVVPDTQGFTSGVVFGTMNRLAGADLSIYVNMGGRFSFTKEQCLDVADKCRAPLGKLKQTWPTPAGGMKLEQIPEMVDMYGDDVAFLIGGALSRGDLATNAKKTVEQVMAMEG